MPIPLTTFETISVPYLLITTLIFLLALVASATVERSTVRWLRPRRPAAPTLRARGQGRSLAALLVISLLATAHLSETARWITTSVAPSTGVVTSVVIAAATGLWLAVVAPSFAASTLWKTFALSTLVLGSAAVALVTLV